MLRYLLRLSTVCGLMVVAFSPRVVSSDPIPCTHEKASIHGTIHGADGTAFVGARITFLGMEWDSTCRHGVSVRIDAMTDSHGRYRLTVPSGRGSLSVRRPHGGQDVLRMDELLTGDIEANHRFEEFHIRGRIAMPDSVLGEAIVTYYPDPGRGTMICGTGLPEIETRAGAFDVAVGSRGRYIFSARSAPSWPMARGIWTSVSIQSDTVLTLDLGGQVVEGTVRGYAGHPLAHAGVFAFGPNASAGAIADSGGRFQVRLPTGSYSWSVEPRDPQMVRWASALKADVDGSTTVVLDLEAVEWVGMVRYEWSTETVPRVLVSAEEEGVGSGFPPARCLTDEYGQFRLLARRGASHRLVVTDTSVPTWAEPRVRRLVVDGVSAERDSTFDISVERLWRPPPQRVVCPLVPTHVARSVPVETAEGSRVRYRSDGCRWFDR